MWKREENWKYFLDRVVTNLESGNDTRYKAKAWSQIDKLKVAWPPNTWINEHIKLNFNASPTDQCEGKGIRLEDCFKIAPDLTLEKWGFKDSGILICQRWDKFLVMLKEKCLVLPQIVAWI